MDWFLEDRPELNDLISYCCLLDKGKGRCHRLLAIPTRAQLERVLRYVLDENEFLSPYGIRSLSRVHKDRPYIFRLNGQEHRVDYEPGESATHFFGGNSNWRGPVWFPLNYLLIEALERYHHFYGDGLQVECPTGSGKRLNLQQVADELACAAGPPLPARRPRAPALSRRRPPLCRRPALARPAAVPRILPRRNGPRPGRQPSDRLDGACDPAPRTAGPIRHWRTRPGL